MLGSQYPLRSTRRTGSCMYFGHSFYIKRVPSSFARTANIKDSSEEEKWPYGGVAVLDLSFLISPMVGNSRSTIGRWLSNAN